MFDSEQGSADIFTFNSTFLVPAKTCDVSTKNCQ